MQTLVRHKEGQGLLKLNNIDIYIINILNAN